MRQPILTTFIFLLVCVPAPVLAQYKVEGFVRAGDGTPIAEATVTLEPQNLHTVTDAAGKYVFDSVTPGSYVRIIVSSSGKTIAERSTRVSFSTEQVDLTVGASPTAPQPIPKTGATPSFVRPGTKRSDEGEASVAQGGSGIIRGTVRSADGLPFPGASVTIDGTTLFETTDTIGRFAFVNLRTGVSIVLNAAAPGLSPASWEVVVPADGQPLQVDFTLELAPLSETVNVSAEVPMLQASGGASNVVLRPEQVASLPSLGEKDIFRALQLLPGVTGSQEASSGLYVRGGTPDQTLVSYDGYTLYHVDHLFGYFSAFNMEAVEQVDFSKSAFKAADGGRLSGVLRLTGKSQAAQKATASVNMSMLSMGGLVSIPFGERGSFLLATRRSFQSPLYDQVLNLVSSSSGAMPAPGRGAPFGGGAAFETTPKSWFYDLNSKFDLRVTAKDRVSASLYNGRDDLDNSRDLQFPSFMLTRLVGEGIELPSDVTMETTDIQSWRNRGASVTWARRWSPSVSTTFSFGRSDYSSNRNRASIVTSPSTGEDYSVSIGRGGGGGQSEANSIRDTTIRLDNSFAIGSNHVLSVGGETTKLEVDYAAQTEVIQGPGPGGAAGSQLVPLLDQSGTGFLATVYAQDRWTPVPRLTLSPGVRVTRYDITVMNYAEPRLSASYQLTPRVRLKGGWGIFNQMANRIASEDRMQGDREFWTLADGSRVPVAGSQQTVGGASYETAGFLIDVEAYHKTLEHLTTFAPRFTPGAMPAEGADYLHRGSGTARGLEVLLQKKFGEQTGWVSYTLGRIEDKFPSLEAEPFPATHDQTHEIKVADSIRVGERWTIGGTWILATGRPYTPAEAIEPVTLPVGFTVYQMTFGKKNSERLPTYHRLDLSTQGEFPLFDLKSALGVTVFNVYDRQNVWYREYQAFGSTGSVNDVMLMGRAFNVFFRVSF